LLTAVAALALLLPAGRVFAAEPSAAGDIPDTQAFVRYTAPAGYSLLVPEGWSRTVRGNTVTFSSHFDGLEVTVLPRTPTGAARRAAGPAKTSTVSQPDPVTGKRVRLDDEEYVFVKGARAAVLHLWAPHGADNADQWLKIARSFRWR
jgi:hypothetical protein